MTQVITTCPKCNTGYSWDTSYQRCPNCPRCGHNAMAENNAKIKALKDAAAKGDKEKVASLVHRPYASINAGPWTALHHAVFGNQIEIARYLLENRASPEACYPQAENETPLHSAASRSRYEMAMLLVAYGGKLDVKNIHGKTPVDIAKKANDEKMVSLFERVTTEPNMISNFKLLSTKMGILKQDLDLLQVPLRHIDDEKQKEQYVAVFKKSANNQMLLNNLSRLEQQIREHEIAADNCRKRLKSTSLEILRMFRKERYNQRINSIKAESVSEEKTIAKLKAAFISIIADLQKQSTETIKAEIEAKEQELAILLGVSPSKE